MKQYFCVGTYTEPILFGTGEVLQGKGKGISICSLEAGEIEVVTSISVRNPSYLCLDEMRNKIYAVNEMKEYLDAFGGGVTQLSYDESWQMAMEETCNIGGTDPCHILLAQNGEFLSVANFASGSVTIVPVGEDGMIDAEHQTLFQHEGKSIHPIRQTGPHAHATIECPDQPLMYVPDLGTDTLYIYRYQGGHVELDKDRQVTVTAGSGPRSGIFSVDGKHFYLICEISSQVMHFTYEHGNLVKQSTVKTLPDDYNGENICSDIHLTPDGTYLYASNRGHDSIVAFKVYEDGSLEFIERQGCRGKTPRNFAVAPTGDYLLCGNQDSDTISVFIINGDGTLDFKETVPFGTPVCIRFFYK